MSYLLSGLDLVVNNTTNIVVNTNPITIQGDIAPSEKIIAVSSRYNRFSVPDNTPAATIKSTSKANNLTNLTARAIGTTNVSISEPVGGNGLKNLITNYYDSTTYYSPQLLTCVGFNNTSTTIEDLSDNNFTITNNGTAIVSTLAPFSNSYAYASMLFNGTSQYLTITTAINGPLDLATDARNWTIECWFYPTSVTGDRAIFWKGGTTGSKNPSYAFFLSGTTGQWIVGNDGAASANQILSTVFAINTWYHFALVRNGNTLTAYVNGVAETPVTMNFTMSNTTNNLLTIGSSVADGSTRFFAGNISNLNVVKNVAVYKGNFIRPTNNFLPVLVSTLKSKVNTTTYTKLTYEPTQLSLYNNLTYNTPVGQTEVYDPALVGNSVINSYIVDKISNNNIRSDTEIVNVSISPEFYLNGPDAPNILSANTKISYNSLGGNFNGVSSSLSVLASNTGPLDLSTAENWTVECWFYATSLAGQGSIFWKGGLIGSNPSYGFFLSGTTGQWILGDGSTGAVAIQNLATVFAINTWYHFALVRTNLFITAYINGIAETPVAIVGSMNAGIGTTLLIGAASDGRYFSGYITNLRIIKNINYYTNNFTVPTTLLSNTIIYIPKNIFTSTQTSLLILSTLTNSSQYSLTITNSGVTTSIVTPSGLSGSLSFNGTTNRLSIPGPNSSVLDLSQNAVDWTIECWFRKNNITSDGCIFWKDATNGTVNPSYALWIQNGGQPQWVVGDGNSGNAPAIMNMNTTIVANTWYHFALVRSGNTITAYLNGIADTSATMTKSMGQQGNNLTIGAAVDPTLRLPFGGYISNFRIIKGVALYSNNFTVPTTSLTTETVGYTVPTDAVSLLILQGINPPNPPVNNIVDNSTYANTIENVGVSTLIPYFSSPPLTNSISAITGPYTISTPSINETNIEYINYKTDPKSVNKQVKNLIVGTTGVIEELQSWS